MNNSHQQSKLEKWEISLDNWLASDVKIKDDHAFDMTLSKKLQAFKDSPIDYLIDENLSELPCQASKDFADKVMQRLEENNKVIRFPIFLSWATPIAAAIALTFAIVINQSPSSQQGSMAQYKASSTIENTIDSEIAEIFALASTLHSISDISDASRSIDAYARFVD